MQVHYLLRDRPACGDTKRGFVASTDPCKVTCETCKTLVGGAICTACDWALAAGFAVAVLALALAPWLLNAG